LQIKDLAAASRNLLDHRLSAPGLLAGHLRIFGALCFWLAFKQPAPQE
jgi:hypothetical protein